jgi:hypothetical protein
MTDFRTSELLISASIVFQVNPDLNVSALWGQLARRERWVLLLIDGKRTLADLAHLTHRGESDVAYTLVRLLQLGYIEQADLAESNLRSQHKPL